MKAGKRYRGFLRLLMSACGLIHCGLTRFPPRLAKRTAKQPKMQLPQQSTKIIRLRQGFGGQAKKKT